MSGGANKRQQPQPETRFLTVRETAARLRLCDKQIRRLIKRGELVAYRFGSAIRIRLEDIEVYVAARRVTIVYKRRN